MSNYFVWFFFSFFSGDNNSCDSSRCLHHLYHCCFYMYTVSHTLLLRNPRIQIKFSVQWTCSISWKSHHWLAIIWSIWLGFNMLFIVCKPSLISDEFILTFTLGSTIIFRYCQHFNMITYDMQKMWKTVWCPLTIPQNSTNFHTRK